MGAGSPPPGEAEPVEGQHGKDPLLGAYLGDYLVQEMVGAGGMGFVYRGIQPVIGKPVAIKVLRPEIAKNPRQMQRLLAEARAANAIQHRGIIDIFTLGQTTDKRSYIVMEYLHGEPLDAVLMGRAPLPPTEVLTILSDVLAALSATHAVGVIHRDLKPSNIFVVSQAGGTKYTKLLDFGLAKQSALPGGDTPQTQVSVVVGTPEYMAPEQARGDPVGPKTDIYALGVIAFQMVTGQLPFQAGSPVETLLRQVNAPAPRASSVLPSVPPVLDELILRMMAKSPEQRPPSADAVRQEMLAILKVLMIEERRRQAGVSPAGTEPTPRRSLRRVFLWAALVLVTPVFVFDAWSRWHGRPDALLRLAERAGQLTAPEPPALPPPAPVVRAPEPALPEPPPPAPEPSPPEAVPAPPEPSPLPVAAPEPEPPRNGKKKSAVLAANHKTKRRTTTRREAEKEKPPEPAPLAPPTPPPDDGGLDALSLMKRINALEKKVFEQGEDADEATRLLLSRQRARLVSSQEEAVLLEVDRALKKLERQLPSKGR